MNGQDGLVLWVLAGAGVLLLYSAYSKQHPAAVLSKTLGAPAAARDTADGGRVPAPPAPPKFRSRLAGEVPDAYAQVAQLYIPGTVSA